MTPAGLRLDHVAVVAPALDAGAAWTEARLGLPMEAGGQHPQMGTHNRLLSLGPDLYLEVIAVDPRAAAPAHRRWFDLDAPPAAPRLGFVLADPGLRHGVAHDHHALTRGDLAWTFAQPRAGGLQPGLIDWGDSARPPTRLPDRGARLVRLTVPALVGLPPLSDGRIAIDAAARRITAEIATPQGLAILG